MNIDVKLLKPKTNLPKILSVSVAELPFKTRQSDLKDFSREMFSSDYPDIEKILEAFDNAEIDFRNLAVPLDYFKQKKSFRERNELYAELAVKYSVETTDECLEKASAGKDELTDMIFVSSTGISTPSIDALIINQMRLNPYINRIPVWGLGCAGGVSGIAKASAIASANPDALVLVIAAELCSLTFIREDISKSNLIATGLFSDGIASVLIAGDNVKSVSEREINIKGSQSRLYYDSLDVMGWEVMNSGFKVVFSKDIPSIVENSVRPDLEKFLVRNKLELSDIKNFIVHPGGKKVIEAYINALGLNSGQFSNTKKILRNYGNMSSATVLYVLNEFTETGTENGFGLMMSLGPGFSSEMVLLDIQNN